MLTAAVVATGVGIFIYTDRDGPGRTQDGLVAADFIRVAPNVSGELVELAVQDNQQVKAGDLLFRLDDRPYRARFQSAKGEHARALAAQEDKQVLLERTQAAAKDNAISRQALADARAGKDMAAADVIETAGKLALAQVELDYCIVRAPFDGIVTGLESQVGAYVSAGEPLFSLIDVASFHVVAYLKEQYLEPAVPGAKARVVLWQYPGEEFTGKVQSVGRGVHARIQLDGLPVIAKTLDWVQLAARIPVRVKLDTDKPLTLGTTAHVTIKR